MGPLVWPKAAKPSERLSSTVPPPPGSSRDRGADPSQGVGQEHAACRDAGADRVQRRDEAGAVEEPAPGHGHVRDDQHAEGDDSVATVGRSCFARIGGIAGAAALGGFADATRLIAPHGATSG